MAARTTEAEARDAGPAPTRASTTGGLRQNPERWRELAGRDSPRYSAPRYLLADDLMTPLLFRFAPAEQVQRTQRAYVDYFRTAGARTVLDVGCGRGLFLQLLREAGISGLGVDRNPQVVEQCRQMGFEQTERADVLEFLGGRVAEGSRVDGIFLSHMIEHFPSSDGLHLLELCAKLLGPGGRLLVVTPNVANPLVWTHVFWLDPTHVRPYPRDLLVAVLEAVGLRKLASFDDRATAPPITRQEFRNVVRAVLRYGFSALMGMDAVVVAEKPQHDPDGR